MGKIEFVSLDDKEAESLKRKPTHMRVSSLTLRIDEDTPAIVGAVEVGVLEQVEHPDGKKRKEFILMGRASASIRGSDLDKILSKAQRKKIKDAMIQAAKSSGSLGRAL